MNNKQLLSEKYQTLIEYGSISKELPYYIESNLNPKFKYRPYQIEALSCFIFHIKQNLHERHLLFHMATGSGKTLIMAGAILELYKLGYRNFIFFVQSTTIIKKTIDNFLKLNHSKYLFNDSINIEGKNIYINKVSNFSFARSNDLNIIFTTTQGLHSNIKNPSENSLTFESFEDQKIVFIADEAHHINADTKESKKVKESRLTWESTVTKLFNANSENYLLEYTATADLDHPEIKQKYFDKLIFFNN